jgi:protein transport protein SEC24
MYAIDLKLVYDCWDRISNTFQNHILPRLQRETTVLFQQQQTTSPHSTPFSPKIGFFLFDQHACYFPYYSDDNECNRNDNNINNNSKSEEPKLQLAVMADMCEDPFCPMPLDMICYDIATNSITNDLSKSLFHQLLEAIPNLVLGMAPATTSSAAAIGAVMTVLHCALGSTGGRGSILSLYQGFMGKPTTTIILKSQQQHQQLKELLIADRKFYERLGEKYHKASIRLDVVLVVVPKQKYSHTPSSINLLTLISHLCNTTCGKLRKIHLDPAPIVAATEECPLALEMSKLCTIVDTATDAVLKLRMSNGIRLNSHRPFSARQVSGQSIVVNDLESPELEMSHIGAESCIVMNLEHSSGASLESKVYFQVALLYTTPLGQRRVRVMNLCLDTMATPSMVFRNADYCSLSAMLSRHLVSEFWESYYDNHYKREHDNSTATILALEGARSQLVDTVVQILTCYRLHTTANKSPSGQLILPETLQLLPLWSLSALKSASLRGNIRGRTTWDDRIYHLQALLDSNPSIVTLLVHPNMYRVDQLGTGQGEWVSHVQKDVQAILSSKSMDTYQPYFQLPETIPCSMSCMEDDGVYVIDDAFTLHVYVGKSVSSDIMSELFDVTSPIELNSKIVASEGAGVVGLDCIRKDSALGEKIRVMLFALRNWFDKERPTSTPVVLQTGVDLDNTNSNVLQYLLVDDPYPEEEEKGYVDFLCMLHKRIKQQVDKEQNRL